MTHIENDPDPVANELDEIHEQATPGAVGETKKSDALIPAADPKERGAPPSIDEGDPATTADASGTSETD
ncbi:hypothetical protein [Sphingomonas prati]|uniref:Uncharacterized protein n=1 Tax=Sphingomonas prati TaxID=1843237 RepID=A0A7W9BUQ1_9SPHN|nr:hypothetical protein [Sphingomonas prati]MBB5730462.1 hypothetical protein [Sphingomonas prati]GGE94241.1 hypothetical protein GCM10011404_29130 [Sphingomonas prati]